MSEKVYKYLKNKQVTAPPGLAEKWSDLENDYTKRLWHPLTLKLQEFIKEKSVEANHGLIELYDNFIQEIELRINSLSLMELCTKVAAQYDKPEDALKFLDRCEDRVRTSPVAFALHKITKGTIKLEKQHDVAGTKVILEELEEMFRQFDGISPVHGRFYCLQSKFYWGENNLVEYYKSALKFLGCPGTCPSDLTHEEQMKHAINLAIAALLADGIYNFGELLAHPVLLSLKRTKYEWLVGLMEAFNSGNVTEFEHLKSRWGQEEKLAKNEFKLRTKVILLAIMEMTFKRVATERQFTFKDVAEAAKLPEEQVEMYVMKAISKGLINGTIDQEAQKIYMKWVQPRVLDTSQIGTLMSRLDKWRKDLRKAETMMEAEAKIVESDFSLVSFNS
ncbi:26S proteasome non-ATPase regulatory subunit 13 [Orchesella cincta]|uniref:26S proteasome non-ATPase regulatory subunit 13 n=1 Tax=Orchesella cincta TaxID=48709 RepID=A0A1D2MXQ1_ORCCI|nr:26S proteasome non-ATPase regulatory subunit 13 [Orchesella cincta]